MTRKSSRSTPVVISGILYSEDAYSGTRVDSVEWFEFIATGTTFYFDEVGFTVRSEKRRGGLSWYAFKRLKGVLVKRYVGRCSGVTLERLKTVARHFED